MAESSPKKFWRASRRVFRSIRILSLFAIFIAVFAVVYLHEIGIPDFLKRPLLQKIHDSGFDVQFSSMRWSWPNRIRIEHPKFSTTNDSAVQIVADFFEVQLHTGAAAQRKLRIDSVSLVNGRVTIPTGTNQQTIVLTNINTAIHLASDRTVQVDRLHGQFDGATISITGVLTNFVDIPNWKMFQQPQPSTATSGQPPLEQFLETWKTLKFAAPPELTLSFSGDASRPETIVVDSDLMAKSRTETPWGKARNLHLHGTYRHRLPEESAQLAEVSGSTDFLQAEYGTASKVNVALSFSPEKTNAWSSNISLQCKRIDFHWNVSKNTERIKATDLQWNGNVICASNLNIQSVSGKLQLASAESNWGNAQRANAIIRIARNEQAQLLDESYGFWKQLGPWRADWELDFSGIKTPRVELQHASTAGSWRSPQLSFSRLDAELYDGEFHLDGDLDIATRKTNLKVVSGFDAHQLSTLFPELGKRILGNLTWERPPQLSSEVHATLPSWNSGTTNWFTSVLPTLAVAGRATIQEYYYEALPVFSTKIDFVYSNSTWQIPALRVVRPEGFLQLSLRGNSVTRENKWDLDSTIDPKVFKAFFSKDAQDVFDLINLGGPPKVHAEISEAGLNFKDCRIQADFIITNVAFRGLELALLKGALTFTNQLLAFSDIRAEKGDQITICPNAEIDFSQDKVFIHEAFSTMDPMPVTRAIGRKVAAAIEAYRFHKPPTVYVEGSFVFDHPETGDMHFLVEGEQFEWGIFKAEKAIGKVDWIGETLSVTNITATAFKGGQLEGWVSVDFRSRPGNNFQIGITYTNLDLHTGLLSLGKTNGLEGTLSGKINLTEANTKDLDHWKGFGWMQLRDGLIWDVPIFGIFSPILNAIAPGTGSSRAREALASFVITNSIIRSDDLEIHSPAVRINYRGTVDFQQQVNAKVDAQILRDAGSLGHIVSIALQPLTKIFEYKLTGSLENPKSEPVFIPKILMTILRPFNSLRKMLPEKTDSSAETATTPIEATPTP
jgi:hypothetical protein